MAACNIPQRLPEMSPEAVKYFMEKLLPQIYQHFDEQCLVDVTFKLSNPKATITAHRLILSSASPYFRELFKSDKGLRPLIEFSEIDSDTFGNLITVCYTGETFITIDNVDRMLKAALMLQLDVAVTNCVEFVLENIIEYTLLRAYALERETQCSILKNKIFEYEIRNFMSVVQNDEFLNFEPNKLQQLIECDHLNVPTEKDVFEAVKLWYEHDCTSRQQELPNLVKCLRLTQFDTNLLLKKIRTLPGCELIALNALLWISCPSARSELSMKYTEERGKALFMALNIEDHNIFQYKRTEDIWQKWGDININQKSYRVVLMDDSLVFIGGLTPINAYVVDIVISWNLKTKTFKELPSMIQARHSHFVVILDGIIYAIGGVGLNGEYLKSVEMFSGTKQWKSINSLIIPRADSGVVAFNGKIYVLGGYNGRYLTSVECYDPKTGCWNQCADMHTGRRYPGTAVHKGQIFVIGGCIDLLSKKMFERYDPQQNEWTKICSLKIPLEGASCISISNQLWALGGLGQDSVSVYNEENDTWISRKPMAHPGRYYCFTMPKVVCKNECEN